MSAKEDARMIEAMLDKQDREFTRTSEALEKFVSDVASQLLETARGMSTSPAHDRSGCLWFCGMMLNEYQQDERSDVCPVPWFKEGRWFGDDGEAPRYCTARCRDLKVGPLEAPVETPKLVGYEHYREAFVRAFCPPAPPTDEQRVDALQKIATGGLSAASRAAELAKDLYDRGYISKSTARELVMSGGYSPMPPLPPIPPETTRRLEDGIKHGDIPPLQRPVPPGITCPCCKVTSPGGKAHLGRCEVPQPSAVAAAPRPYVFVPSVSEYDLLPDADR